MIRTLQEESLARVTIAAPERRNALGLAMWQELRATFTQLASAPHVRCVLLAGEGSDFSAGADIGEFAQLRGTAEAARHYDATMRAALRAVRDFPHPVVAVVRGHCLGAGLELALMADIRLAAEDARLGIPGTRVGQGLGFMEVEALVRAAGHAAAAEILFSARLLGAEEALAMRLVNRVVPVEELAEAGTDLALRIGEGAPLVNRWHKQALRRLADPAPVTPAEHDELYRLCESADWHEGYAAFLAKRKPAFRGI